GGACWRARGRGRRRPHGGALAESLPARPAGGRCGGEDLYRDELRRVSRRRGRRVGGTESGGRTVAVRRRGRRDLPVDLLRPSARHARLRRAAARARRGVEARHLYPVARAPGGPADGGVALREVHSATLVTSTLARITGQQRVATPYAAHARAASAQMRY